MICFNFILFPLEIADGRKCENAPTKTRGSILDTFWYISGQNLAKV